MARPRFQDFDRGGGEYDYASWRAATEQFTDSHTRRPPLPHYRQRFWGYCRWCGEAIERPDGSLNRRRSWHHDCVALYNLAVGPAAYAREIALRQGGICPDCRDPLFAQKPHRAEGVGRPGWWVCWIAGKSVSASGYFCGVSWPLLPCEIDHEVPLWSVDKTKPDAIRFWLWDNLRARCIPCHRAKTAREAVVRAKERRQSAKQGISRGKPAKRKLRVRDIPF